MHPNMSFGFSFPKELLSLLTDQHRLYPVTTGDRLSVPKQPGLYTFWWGGPKDGINGKQKVVFQGPKIAEGPKPDLSHGRVAIKGASRGNTVWYEGHVSNFEIAKQDRHFETAMIPLYVGKSTNLYSRVRQHLMPGTESSSAYLTKRNKKGEIVKQANYTAKPSTIFKRDTQSQFRAGMEYVFRREAMKDDGYTFRMIREHIHFSYRVVEDNDDEVSAPRHAFKRRFYWEDLLIGTLQPWFNLDGER